MPAHVRRNCRLPRNKVCYFGSLDPWLPANASASAVASSAVRMSGSRCRCPPQHRRRSGRRERSRAASSPDGRSARIAAGPAGAKLA